MEDASADTLPNQTLYINNLNERIRQDEMKRALYAICSQFGTVMDIVVMKTFRLRGQAWVVFEDLAMAANAMRSLNGFDLFDKEMRICYAKTKSHVVAKADGTYVAPDRAERSAHNKKQREKLDNRKAKAAAAMRQEQEEVHRQQMLIAGAEREAMSAPHHILFVEALPKAATEDMVSTLFKQFPGFKEVRMIPAKPGIAFVEFDSSSQAGVAMSGLQGFKITQDDAIIVSFAKK